MHTLYLVATVTAAVFNNVPVTSYQPVELNKGYLECNELARVYQQREGHRGSFVCMPNGASIIGYPVAPVTRPAVASVEPFIR